MIRYSRRLAWDAPQNAFSRLLDARRAAGAHLLDLTVTNPTQVDLAYPHAEIAAALARVSDFTYRPEAAGSHAARLAIGAEPSRILLTASTSEAYSLLFKLLCDPGDEVLVPQPSYPLFEYLAALEAVRIVPYRLSYDGGWFVDFDTVDRALSPRTRAIVVVNPNNPTGSFLKQPEADRLSAFGIPLISDEVFTDYALTEHPSRATLSDSHLWFGFSGLSKSAGMPQMKIGWITLHGPDAEIEPARDRLELLLDTYLPVATPIQSALPELLKIGAGIREQIRTRTKQNLAALRDLLRDSAAHPLYTEGGWSAIVQLPNHISEEEWITRLLTDHDVVVQPGYFFDMHVEAFVVVSLIAPLDTFREGITRLRAATAQY